MEEGPPGSPGGGAQGASTAQSRAPIWEERLLCSFCVCFSGALACLTFPVPVSAGVGYVAFPFFQLPPVYLYLLTLKYFFPPKQYDYTLRAWGCRLMNRVSTPGELVLGKTCLVADARQSNPRWLRQINTHWDIPTMECYSAL